MKYEGANSSKREVEGLLDGSTRGTVATYQHDVRQMLAEMSREVGRRERILAHREPRQYALSLICQHRKSHGWYLNKDLGRTDKYVARVVK